MALKLRYLSNGTDGIAEALRACDRDDFRQLVLFFAQPLATELAGAKFCRWVTGCIEAIFDEAVDSKVSVIDHYDFASIEEMTNSLMAVTIVERSTTSHRQQDVARALHDLVLSQICIKCEPLEGRVKYLEGLQDG